MSRAKYFGVFSEAWIPAFAGMTGVVVIFDRVPARLSAGPLWPETYAPVGSFGRERSAGNGHHRVAIFGSIHYLLDRRPRFRRSPGSELLRLGE
jgi:hypothetical protein